MSWSRKKVKFLHSQILRPFLANNPIEEEEEEESEAESDEEETREPAPADGLQTPSGLETPSGMTSVVSTVAGGLETPDFLELRKGRSVSEAMEASGPRSLYQVVPEKQTSVRGLMGSERGYDVSAVASAPLPVLGEERGTKVRVMNLLIMEAKSPVSSARMVLMCLSMQESWKGCQKRNCGENMMLMLAAMLEFLVLGVGVKIFLTWSPKRWRRRSRRWTGKKTEERAARSSNFEGNNCSLACITIFAIDRL